MCSNMVYGELGRFPLDVDIRLRALSFGARLIKVEMINCRAYKAINQLHVQALFTSERIINYITNLLGKCGVSGV